MPVPPVHAFHAADCQLYVQPLKSLTVWLAAGLVAALQLASATVVPSERLQETVRVCVALDEHELLDEPHAPATHAYVHVSVNSTL